MNRVWRLSWRSQTSAAELHGFREEFQQFKDSQPNERANQQAQHLLGQTVEKLGHLVEKQTEFLGKLLPKLLGQQEAKEDTKRERDFTPSTKDPCKDQRVLPNLREVNTTLQRQRIFQSTIVSAGIRNRMHFQMSPMRRLS